MNILYVCHRFPFPPKRGGKIRPFQMIRHLSGSHRVVVASLARSSEEAAEGQGIAPHCTEYHMVHVGKAVQAVRTVGRLPTMTPSSIGYFYSPELARTIRRLIERERFDLIVVHCSSVARYVQHARGIPKILDFGDMDSQKWLAYSTYRPFPLSLGYWLEGTKLEREEKRLATLFDLCTVTTKAEWQTLEDFGTGVPTGWFPNGVDADYFSPTDEPYDAHTMCFIGRMDYYPNEECMVEFCHRTLPLVRALRPGMKLLIVGADPSPAVRRLADIEGVTVTGSVPDVRPFVRRSALTVSPLNIARGVQNKILESMALGVPVVTSPAAARGVDANDQEHFLVAKTPEDTAAAVVRLAGDPAERERLSRAGRSRMLSHHDWKGSMTRFDGLMASCLENAAGDRGRLRIRARS
jgi:sugar transferase (PEP-CTERM/EpsH1 system associated)